MSVLTAYKLTKSFGVDEIFRDVSLQLNAGEKVAMVGPNGAGKTTLLNILAGLDQPDAGEVVTARGLRIGYLTQEAILAGESTLHAAMLEAFDALRAQESVLRALEQRMSASGDELEAVMAEYATRAHAFDEAGGYTYELRIDRVLSGLGFEKRQYDEPVSILSGGQRTRAALARLLLISPDLLLLDEPTNHLDLAAMEWLEDYLVHWPGAVLAVAHDRRFLDRVVTRVLELSFGRVEDFPGNYTSYTELRAERMERRIAEFEAQAAYIAKTQEFIRRYGAGQRAREAKGRQKRLDRLARLQRPQEMKRLHLDLSTQRRSGDMVLACKCLAVGYPGRLLFQSSELTIRRGDRVALLGPNGCGKTTFLKTVLGQVAPLAGQFRFGANVRPGYYAQTHEGLNASISILDTILPLLPNLEKSRNLLARYLFTGDDVFKRVGDLSGGERSRVALAVLALHGANFLLMDEPTNHLDLLSQEVLEDVLGDFPGTIFFVSHDRYFIDALATAVWAVEGTRIVAYQGGYEDYLDVRSAPPAVAEVKSLAPPAPKVKNLPTGEANRPVKARVMGAEQRIVQLEERLAILSEELTVASQALSAERVGRLGREYEVTRQKLDAAYTEWEALGAT
jgi:ATP-binding cassette subfamily F protein 3